MFKNNKEVFAARYNFSDFINCQNQAKKLYILWVPIKNKRLKTNLELPEIKNTRQYENLSVTKYQITNLIELIFTFS